MLDCEAEVWIQPGINEVLLGVVIDNSAKGVSLNGFTALQHILSDLFWARLVHVIKEIVSKRAQLPTENLLHCLSEFNVALKQSAVGVNLEQKEVLLALVDGRIKFEQLPAPSHVEPQHEL